MSDLIAVLALVAAIIEALIVAGLVSRLHRQYRASLHAERERGRRLARRTHPDPWIDGETMQFERFEQVRTPQPPPPASWPSSPRDTWMLGEMP